MSPQTPVAHSSQTRVSANGIYLVYDTFGTATDPPLLLIMGLGAQLISWDDEFCRQLAACGFWVIRYDNRDVGLSTKFDGAQIPELDTLLQARMSGQADQIVIPYTLVDMAEDAIGLLDALRVAAAHVVGLSLGGMIAQLMAIQHSNRVLTLTSIMSTTNDPTLPLPSPSALDVLLTPLPSEREAFIAQSVQNGRLLHGDKLPFDENRVQKRAAARYDRSYYPEGTARQLAAVLLTDNRQPSLASVTAPTLVIHGEVDPLIPVEGGKATAAAVPGAKLVVIQGMGHALPPQVWPQVIQAIAHHAGSPG